MNATRKPEAGSQAAVAGLLILAALGAAARLAFLFETTWIEADCSVLGLIAKRIAEGREFSPYLWMAQYSGTLSALITAVWFKMFAVTPLAYQVTGFLFSCSHAALIALLARRLLGSPGWYFAAALALLPTYETLSWMFLYQYGDTLALGCGVLLILLRDADDPRASPAGLFAVAGLLSGLGLWTSPLFVPFLLTEGVVFLRRKSPRWKIELALWLPFFVTGYAPAIFYNLQHPGAQFHHMAGRLLNIGRDEWTAAADPLRLLLHKAFLKATAIPGVAARLPGEFATMTDWLDCVVLAAGTFWAWGRRRPDAADRRRWSVLWIFLEAFIAYTVFFVAEPFYRLTFPLYVPFSLLAACGLAAVAKRSRGAAAAALGLLLVPHLWTLARGLENPEKMSVPELVDFLRARGIDTAYADYWLAYPVVFASNEEIIVSPTLLHPTFLERRPEYTARVRASKNPALLLDRVRNSCVIPVVETGLEKLHVRYEKDSVNELLVYHGFSRKIAPEDLGLTTNMTCGPR